MAHVERSVESGASPSQRQGHAIIAGFGLPGRAAAERFDAAGVPYSIIELNPGTVERCAETGTMIIAGDVNEEATLIRAGIREASILIIAIPHETTAVEATALARRLNPSLHIVTRCHYVSKGMEARSQGANQVVVAEQVVAMELAEVVRTLLESPIAIEPKEDSSHG